MRTLEDFQAIVDELRAVCKRHGVIIEATYEDSMLMVYDATDTKPAWWKPGDTENAVSDIRTLTGGDDMSVLVNMIGGPKEPT